MTQADLEAAERISDLAFHELDVRTFPREWDPPERRTPERSARWTARTARFLETDPDGCWVAEDATGLVGFATSMVRERLWILATFAVLPDQQGRGVGRRLLEHATAYGARCERGMLSASVDPLALRRYHQAGFSLHPQMLLRGEVEKSCLAPVGDLREGTVDDREWMDDLDRDLRGGPHGPDHDSLADMARLVVAADRTGYAYTTEQASYVVAAHDPRTAARLLTECLAGAEGVFEVPHVTSVNPWAVDVAMGARLSLTTWGYLALRGMDPPAPYVHNGALL